jgi:biotin carboxyl carrier protein
MIYEFIHKGETKAVELKDNRSATFPGTDKPVQIEIMPGGRLFHRNGDATREIFAVVDGAKTYVDIDGLLFEFATPTQDVSGPGGAAGHMADPSKVFAPMPGKVVKLMVKEGDKVAPKQHLVIVEAMKMENIIVAHGAGTVKKVNFTEGQQCDTETPIIELEPAE